MIEETNPPASGEEVKNEEIKEAVEGETADETVASIDVEKNEDASALEELPDDVKKKLEKTKTEKAANKSKRKKKGSDKKVVSGKAYVKASYNNTIVSLADMNGNIISWASAGMAGFKGAKKSTPYAASIITRIACDRAKERGLKEVMVFVKGVGTGREAAVRALNANGLIVTQIKDVTPMPHNGCRPRKPRRV